MTLLTIGEFARRSRLSARALRRYGEAGLLPPARVDPYSGYRWYAPDQLGHARLVAALRQLGMPLAGIRPLLDVLDDDPAQAARQVTRYWAAAEAEHAARRALAAFLVRQFTGEEAVMYEVHTRQVPERALLCLKRNVDEAGARALGKEFVAILRPFQPVPRLPGHDGAAFAIYHGEVSAESDGPVEWCRPVPAVLAQELAGRFPQLTLRTEPAHEEAYIRLGDTRATPPEWTLVAQSLMHWAAGSLREPSGLGMRVTVRAANAAAGGPGGPGAPGPDSATDSDYAVPLR